MRPLENISKLCMEPDGNAAKLFALRLYRAYV